MVTGWSGGDPYGQRAIRYFTDAWLDASVGTDVTYIKANGTGDESSSTTWEAYWSEYMKLPNGNIIDMSHSRGINLISLSSGLIEDTLEDAIADYNYFLEKANKNLYSVTIYYFADYPNDGKCNQHVIIVDKEEETPKGQKIPVLKLWNDNNNAYNQRIDSVTVELLFNDSPTGQELVLNSQNNWYGQFECLSGKGTYTVREKSSVSEYTTEVYGNQNNGFLILNKLSTQVKVIKKWEDVENVDGIRPESITVTLYANGVSTGKTQTLNAENNWTASFTNLNKYEIETNANDINDINELEVKEIENKYTIKEETIERYTTTYETTQDSNNTTITITNKHTPEDKDIEITGRVWEDIPDGKGNGINGILESDESGLGGIKVTLKDVNGNQFDETSTTTTNADGTYTIKVKYKYASEADVKAKLDTSYVEFSYDGLKYTTVKPMGEKDKAGNAVSTSQQSKATEVYSGRENLDNKYSTITSNPEITKTLNELTETDKNVIAITKNVITSFDTYKAIEGNGEGNSIKNVNLGLFKREQPDLSIESNISEVEVNANGQKNIYKYNAVVTDETSDEVKAQFQNKQSYTYRRPVNPSDITYIKENAEQDESGVYVTYEVTVTNEAKTLITTVHSIINCYDNRYILESVTINGNQVTYSKSSVYGQPETDFSEITLSDLNLKLNPNETSSKIMLRYKVNAEAVERLLNEDATLSNAVEIESYSTYYGENTIYAEQEKGGRTNKPYAGYDKDSHPGNAGIKLQEVEYTYTYTEGNGVVQTKTYTNVKILKSTENLVDYKLEDGTIIPMPEDDTDIAPSFLLYKEIPKTLSGTVFEDTDVTENEERLGDGKYDSTREKTISNVKVGLYNVDGTLATLYDEEGNIKENASVLYTNAQGSYKFEGLEPGKEYYLKFTYGNDTSELPGPTTINGGLEINARNYKSTIITNPIVKGILDKKYEDFTEEDKKWLMNIEDNYSIAVDNMAERVKIEDLQYSNFNKPLNMTAYTKPFIAEIGSEKLDFGIIERPREDLFVEKTITNFKVTLANGQVLTEGDLTKDLNIPYAKTMGFMQNITSGKSARKASEKQVLVELDAELIQGAKLEVQYAVKVTNNNEIDYYYGVTEDYTNIEGWDTLKDYDKYIATSDKAKYYYYGDKNGLSSNDIIKATIEFVDYLNEDLVYKGGMDSWEEIAPAEIYNIDKKLISDATYNAINSSKYKVFKTTVELGNGESEEISTSYAIMSANKVLANQDNNVFDNNAEIISIDGRTARTIQEIDGRVVEKTYKPGNYVPSLEGREVSTDTSKEEAGLHEQDDDRVRIIITPPTGTTTYIIYSVIALIGLIVIAIGIKFIKKKVLIK